MHCNIAYRSFNILDICPLKKNKPRSIYILFPTRALQIEVNRTVENEISGSPSLGRVSESASDTQLPSPPMAILRLGELL